MNREILYIKKQDNSSSFDQNYVINVFENSNSLADIKTTVENAEDRLYVSWASVDIRDNAGEKIPIDEVINQQEMLIRRNGPITDNHTNKIVGQTLAYKVMMHPKSNTLGVLHLDKIFNDNNLDAKVWGEIVTGKRTGSSVGGFNEDTSFEVERNGEPTRILGGFSQLETASVYKPCNPLALNEAFSVVAKSECANKEELDKGCGKESDKEVEKEDIDETKKSVSRESDLNKESVNNNIKKGDIQMTEEIMKKLSEIADIAKANSEAIAEIKKADMKVEEEKEKEKEEKMKEAKKQAAASDIEGEASAKAPEDPKPDESNDLDVVKTMESMIAKKFEEMKSFVVEKTTTPVSKNDTKAEDIKKAEKLANTAMDMALGKVKMTAREVRKSQEEYNKVKGDL